MRLEIHIGCVSYEQAQLIDRRQLHRHSHAEARARSKGRRRKEKKPHALVRLALELQISIDAGECALVTAAPDERHMRQQFFPEDLISGAQISLVTAHKISRRLMTDELTVGW